MLMQKRFKSSDDWLANVPKKNNYITNIFYDIKRKNDETIAKEKLSFQRNHSRDTSPLARLAMGVSGSKDPPVIEKQHPRKTEKVHRQGGIDDRMSKHNHADYSYDPDKNEVIKPYQRTLVRASSKGPTTTLNTTGSSINSSKVFDVMLLRIQKLRFGIDKHVTQIDEKSSAVLKYRTPHFRALATVEIPPLDSNDNIQIGWIQVCNEMQFINKYGSEGLTSWEFPEIVSGKYRMISDADGRQYPWYGSKNEVATLQGPTSSPIAVTIQMNDNFFPQVTWYIPHTSYIKEPSLTFVYRKQNFFTYLALKNLNVGSYQVLKTITWSMELAIDINPNNSLGKRAKLLGPFEQEPAKIVTDYNISYPEKYALSPPNANNSQVLIWRPRVGEASVVVPPVQTTMDITKYLQTSRDLSLKLNRLARNMHAQYSG